MSDLDEMTDRINAELGRVEVASLEDEIDAIGGEAMAFPDEVIELTDFIEDHYGMTPEEWSEYQREEYQAYHDQEEADKASLMRVLEAAIRNPKRVGENDWQFTDAQRWACIIKAMLCVAFGWYKLDKHGDYPDEVDLGTIHSNRDSYGWDASWMVVGYGIFKNWFVGVESDSDSFL